MRTPTFTDIFCVPVATASLQATLHCLASDWSSKVAQSELAPTQPRESDRSGGEGPLRALRTVVLPNHDRFPGRETASAYSE